MLYQSHAFYPDWGAYGEEPLKSESRGHPVWKTIESLPSIDTHTHRVRERESKRERERPST